MLIVPDNINVLSINSANNYFREYSIQGHDHPRSYFYVSQMDNGEKIGFIAVDLCLTVGLKLQYNFAGKLTDEEEQNIRKFVQQARDYDVKYLFWFGHYPTSTIQYPGSKIVSIIFMARYLVLSNMSLLNASTNCRSLCK